LYLQKRIIYLQYKISNMSIQVKNLHEKLTQSIQTMLIDVTVNLPYYGNFNLFLNFHENNNMPTCGVNVTGKGMNFYYNSEFLNKMSQKEVNFITLHEDFHLLFNHPKRTNGSLCTRCIQ
jgi:predicted metal-dependent peptidase